VNRTPHDVAVRRSSDRWTKLSVLLTSIERSVEASARMDAHMKVSGSIGATHEGLIAFDARLRLLERRIDRELDLLTVERLTLDLHAKQRRVA